MTTENNYTPATAIHAEGARAGIVTCKTCGAAILLDPREEVNAIELHTQWHMDLRNHLGKSDDR